MCPVHNLELYLELTKETKSFKLFVNPDCSEISLNKLRFYMCKFIRKGDPGSFPKVHDLRKLASSYAFFSHMKLDDICSLVGWSSFRVFRKHYLKPINDIKSSLVVLGRKVPGSPSSS